MTVSLLQSAFVNKSATTIAVSSMLNITNDGNNPAYLIVNGLDRNEYTATSTGAKGSFSGNGHTDPLTSLGGDESTVGVVFTWNATTGQYTNATYGNLMNLTYTSSASPNDVTDISFFGASNSLYANTYAPYTDEMATIPSVFTPIGTATIATQPTSTVPAMSQATPNTIAAVAQTFVGDAWNMNGCWVLANTIAAESGAALPVVSNDVGVPGEANGEWGVAYNGPVSANSNWQSLVHTGEIIAFITGSGGGHITTCVSGSGSTAMLIDNIEYVSGSTIVNTANDGSPADISIASAHYAVGEWSGVNAANVVIYELDTPVVTASVTNISMSGNSSASLACDFAAADPFGKAVTEWQAYNTVASDLLSVGGVCYSAAHNAAGALTVASLSGLTLTAGAAATYDTVEVRAYNGSYWGDWTSIGASVTAAAPTAPLLSAPVVVANTANQTWAAGKAVSLAIPGTFKDPQGQTLTYSAKAASGAALPSWLVFNAATGAFTGTPPATAQTLSLIVTATNASGLSGSETFAATILAPPVLSVQEAAQAAYDNTAFSFALPAGTFTDPQGQALTYSATQASGAALPTWLTFNPTTLTFSGTAPATAQSVAISVTATDVSGLSVSETFAFNDLAASAPVLKTQEAGQTVIANTAFSFALPAGSFSDPQGQALTYSATQANGAALPSWLTFNPATLTFSGTAAAAAQTLSLKVTATDTSGLSTSETFALNDLVVSAPVLRAQASAQSVSDNTAFCFYLPYQGFIDPQGQALTLSATLASGAPLPSWMTFNSTYGYFSGTAPVATGTVSVKVTATDTSGLSTSETFAFNTVQAAAPYLNGQTATQTVAVGKAWGLNVPSGTFVDPQRQALTYTATMADGTPLPSWLTFNGPQMRFSGTAPSTAQTVSVKLTATDQSLVSASEIVTFNVVPAAPTLAAQTSAQMLVAGNVFTLAIPGGAFVDPNGQALTYSATQSNGQALPTWLHFNTATDTFSGTAPTTGQSLLLTVKATDISGLSAQETFNTTVIAAPVLNTQDQVATQTWYETGAVSLALPAGSFTDPQGQALTYTASQANGQALPAWLKFNAANQTFTGTAPGTAQTLAMKVTATDTSGVATSETFTANVAPEIVVNPAVASLGNLQVGGTTENITVPASLFTDTLGLPMTFLAYQTSGQNASSWLSFNQNTNTLSGVIPKNIASGAIGLEFVATDTHGISAADMFSITVFTANGYGPSLQPAVYSAIQLPTIQTASSLLAHH